MRHNQTVSILAVALAASLAACGDTRTERAITGGAIGAGTGAVGGALIGGSAGAGALIGGAAGAATGALTDRDDIDLGDPFWE
ncbi:MAG: YMGG-like glycine zipper-containing protein [Thermohalobaculum sp.]|nr:YMGG-like glycine zipper-containing protein [Thermohalobaculum sp.]